MVRIYRIILDVLNSNMSMKLTKVKFKILFVGIIILFLTHTSFSQNSNFEGIIVYQRTASTGKIAFETYYFGNKKLRIDKDFLFDEGLIKSVSIFDFDKYANVYFSKSNGNFEEKIISDKNYLKSFEIDTTHTKKIINYACAPLQISLEGGYYSTKHSQIKYLADSLVFEIPDKWYLDWIMVSHIDNRIALLLEETIESDAAGQLISGGYKREAISVVPMKLPDAIFEVENY